MPYDWRYSSHPRRLSIANPWPTSRLLFPSVNIDRRYLIPNVFFPGVLLPFLVFTGLYLYPFFDKLVHWNRSGADHNVLRLPNDQPFHTALGSSVFVFLLVLFFAGGDDVIALSAGTSLVMVRGILRILALAAPPLTFALVYGLCKTTRRRLVSSLSEPPLEQR